MLPLDRGPDRSPLAVHPAGADDRATADERPTTPTGAASIKTQETTWTRYINPPEFLDAEQRKKLDETRRGRARFPEPSPQRDVLLFLLEHAPLRDWQRDILSIIREEAYYFAPQGQTKIMNEGWASYWHSQDHDRSALSSRRS